MENCSIYYTEQGVTSICGNLLHAHTGYVCVLRVEFLLERRIHDAAVVHFGQGLDAGLLRRPSAGVIV
jgi:hypothetical protein